MSTEKPLQQITLKHIIDEAGLHFIEKRTQTETSDKVVHSEENFKADEVAVIFLGNHILVALTEVYRDRYPSLDPGKVHVFRYGGSYGPDDLVPDVTDRIAMAREAIMALDPGDSRAFIEEIKRKAVDDMMEGWQKLQEPKGEVKFKKYPPVPELPQNTYE